MAGGNFLYREKDGLNKMSAISVSANPSLTGGWSGMPIEKALTYYNQIYATGILSSIHYGVTLEPFDQSGAIANATVKLFDTYDLVNQEAGHFSAFMKGLDGFSPEELNDPIPLFDENYNLPWLASSIDLSILDAQTDSVNIGHFQLNHITGNSSGEISIPFIETRNAAILNSAKAIKKIMFAKDGTQALPKDYLMVMKIYIYDRHSFSTRVFEIDHLVALQTASIPLDASNKNGAGVVTLNFVKMFPMLIGTE